MKACLVVVRGRWSTSATMYICALACLAMVLTMLSIWSTVVAAEKQGFVVLPGSAPRFSGPVGGEANTAENPRHPRADGRCIGGVAVHESLGGRPSCAYPPSGG